MLGDIDRSLKPRKLELYIAKPDFTVIGKLKEAYQETNNLKLGNINELNLSVPYEIEKNHEMIANPNISKLKDRYLIKAVIGDSEEWYVISHIKDMITDTGDTMQVQAFLLPYELRDKLIRTYQVVSYNARQLLTDALKDTLWRIGYIDADFELKYRSFSVSSSTVLDMVFNISATFNSLIIFDTKNRLINLYKPESIGTNKGLKVKYGKYLKAMNKDSSADEMVTRLKVFGQNDLSIQRVNPTGSNFIEDFSFFMYPFTRNANTKAVLTHSDYWSDGLCNAQLDYQDKLVTKKGEFDSLLSQKEAQQTTLTTRTNELTVLQTDLAVILDNIDVAQAKGNPTAALFQQRDYKQADIDAKKAQITTINTNITNIDNQITTLRSSVALETNFTAQQINERNQYIIEKEWQDTNYTNDKELYADAVKKFNEMKVPQTVIDIDIVNFLSIVEAQRDWSKLSLGDVITIEYEKIGVNVQAKIIEINFDYENDNIKLVIANVKDIERNFEKWVKMLNQSISTSTTVDMSKFKWDTVTTVNDEVSSILKDVWKTAERAINSGVNESVTIDRRGITIKDPTDPLKFIRLTHGVLGITNDGGNIYRQVMDGSGVYAERLVGKIILGNSLRIEDDKGSFSIVGNLLTVKDTTNTIRTQLGEYATGKYGLLLKDKTGQQTILDEDGILQTWQEGRTDNVDASHPLILNVYLPTQTRSIKKALLRFRIQAFRAYETAAASGGGATTSAGGGQTTTSGGGTTQTTASQSLTNTSSGINVVYETAWVDAGGADGHTHSYRNVIGHNHDMTHSHNVTVPSHSHYVSDHYHTVPDHTHGIVYGIYQGATATSVTVKVNGTDRTTTLGGSFSTDKDSLDLTPYMVLGQWNTIELGSSSLGRIDATVFIQALMGV